MTIGTSDKAKDIFYITLAAVIIRILPILFGSPHNRDVVLFMEQAAPILKNQNIYQVTHKVFPYSPITMFIPALCLLLSNRLSVPFHIMMKIPPLIGDISLAIAVYYWAARAGNDRKSAFRGAIAYALNPLIILVGSFQGNIMPLCNLFMFLAVMTAAYDCDKNYRLSALLLGLAVAFRGYAILLLPVILLKSGLSFVKKIKYTAYTVIPSVLIFIPFLLADYKSVFREVLGYGGFIDYGFAAIERARCLYSFVVLHNIVDIGNTMQSYLNSFFSLHRYVSLNPVIMRLDMYSKAIFLSAYLIILTQYRRLELLKLVLVIWLGFYFFYSGVSSQYLIWIIPFFCFLQDRFSRWYTILGTYAVISVYLCYYPPILFGAFTAHPPRSISALLFNELTALSLFWVLCGAWFWALLSGKGSEAK